MTFPSRTVFLLAVVALALAAFPVQPAVAEPGSGARVSSGPATVSSEPAETLAVRTFALRHASAVDLMSTVRTLHGLPRVAADSTRNLLTVRATPEQLERVAELVARYDTRPAETRVTLALVTLDPQTGQPSGGPELLRADTSVVGNGRSSVRVERSPLDESSWLDLAVTLETLSQGDELRLRLAVDSALLRAGSENTRASAEGTWHAGDGSAFLVPLPLGAVLGGKPVTIALRVVPTVVDPGESSS